ncbi:MAG: hypothetical protein PUB29_02405 [Bacteroidales bacterium]|nr:hypothetical protein [Bacteroidales bacterium]
MKNIIRITVIAALAILATACNKPEKQALIGTWQWTCTSGSIAGVNYTPETEGFNAEIVFKGSKFTFYKDGEKVTSGSYRIDVSDCHVVLTECGNATSCVLHLPEEQCEKIAKATDGKIVVVPSGSAIINSFSNEVSLTLWDNMIDGFSSAFVKKN